MCWIGKKIIDRFPRIALKDIKVYKVMRNNGNSFVRNFKYVFEKEMPKVKLGVHRFPDFVEIREGYHSYYGKCELFFNINEDYTQGGFAIIPYSKPYEKWGIINTVVDLEKYSIHEAIIPRWAKYYINEYDEIVSERLIVKNQKIKF